MGSKYHFDAPLPTVLGGSILNNVRYVQVIDLWFQRRDQGLSVRLHCSTCLGRAPEGRAAIEMRKESFLVVIGQQWWSIQGRYQHQGSSCLRIFA